MSLFVTSCWRAIRCDWIQTHDLLLNGSRYDGIGGVIDKINLLDKKRDESSKAVVQILLAASCGDRVALQRSMIKSLLQKVLERQNGVKIMSCTKKSGSKWKEKHCWTEVGSDYLETWMAKCRVKKANKRGGLRGSILSSHPKAPGLNPGFPENLQRNFSMLLRFIDGAA